MYKKAEITRVVLNGGQCMCCKVAGGIDPIIRATK